MKLITLLILMILLAYAVSATVITEFNNSLSTENLTYSSAGNITRYITIPSHSNVTQATIDLFGLSNTDNCYQETTNSSHSSDGSCNQIYNGSYANDTGVWINLENTRDGDWSTYQLINLSKGSYGNIFINYSKPSSAVGAIFQIKTMGVGAVGRNRNYSINGSYFEQDPIQIKFKGNNGGAGNHDHWIYFYNGSEFVEIYHDEETNSYVLYEEAIYWNITYYPTNITIDVNNDSIIDYQSNDKWNTTIAGKDSNIDLNITNINNLCSPLGCDLALRFTSYSIGILKYSNIYVDYVVIDQGGSGGSSSSQQQGASVTTQTIYTSKETIITPSFFAKYIIDYFGGIKNYTQIFKSSKKIQYCTTDNPLVKCSFNKVDNLIGYLQFTLTNSQKLYYKIKGTARLRLIDNTYTDLPFEFTVINWGLYLTTKEGKSLPITYIILAVTIIGYIIKKIYTI